MLSIEPIHTESMFFAMRREWNALLERSRADCVFLSHEWLATWWKHLSDSRMLKIIAVRDGADLVGILPVALRPPVYSRMMPPAMEFIGSGVIGSDYLDVIAAREHEDEVLDAIAHHLSGAGVMLQFSQLRRADCATERLAAKLKQRNWAVSDVKVNICPYIPLQGQSWESYLTTLGSSQRYNLQRRTRNLEKMPGFRIELQTPLQTVIDLHKKRWELRGGESEAFQTEDILAFHREFAEIAARRGWLRLLSIWIEGQPAAALYGLRYGPTFYFYQSGFDSAFAKQSVGLVMMGTAIRTALEEGAGEFDLLHGDEEYKFHWTQETRELGRIEAFPPHVRGALYRRCVGLNRAARRMARRVLIKA
jgi:CelD/BcsL family acetyltransferase involved in cellulose biosynthesis